MKKNVRDHKNIWLGNDACLWLHVSRKKKIESHCIVYRYVGTKQKCNFKTKIYLDIIPSKINK